MARAHAVLFQRVAGLAARVDLLAAFGIAVGCQSGGAGEQPNEERGEESHDRSGHVFGQDMKASGTGFWPSA
jgi:hypothetical protein